MIKKLLINDEFVTYARLIVTANGRPSGTATTKMVTASMKIPTTRCSLLHSQGWPATS